MRQISANTRKQATFNETESAGNPRQSPMKPDPKALYLISNQEHHHLSPSKQTAAMKKGHIDRPESLSSMPVKSVNNLFGKKMTIEAGTKANTKTQSNKSIGQILAIGLKMSND